MRTFKVDQENKIYPRVRFHHIWTRAHTHTADTHTSPSSFSSFVLWPWRGLGGRGGGFLLNQRESGGRRPRMGKLVRHVLVTWKPSSCFLFIYDHKKRGRGDLQILPIPPLHRDGHFAGPSAPFTPGANQLMICPLTLRVRRQKYNSIAGLFAK